LILEKSYLGVVFEAGATFQPSDGTQAKDHNDPFLPQADLAHPSVVLLSNTDEKYTGIELPQLFKEDKFRNTNPLYLLSYYSKPNPNSDLIALLPTFIIVVWLLRSALTWFDVVRGRFNLNQSINPSILRHDEDSEYYSYVYPDKKDSEVNETIKEERNVAATIFNLPSCNLIFELIIGQILNKISSSAASFYEIVFELQTYEYVYDNEFIDQKETGISASTLKDYYQQFTFWNHLEEEDLFSTKNIKALLEKGFEIVAKEDERPIFKKLLLKKYNSLQMFTDMNLNDYKTSLHAYIELICVQTSYDSDEVSFDLFSSNYELFCNLFQLESINIDIAFMKREFNIDSIKKSVQMIERNQKFITGEINNDKKSKKWYSIDLEKMTGYINLAKGGMISDKIDPKRREEIIGKLIYSKHWVFRELFFCISIFVCFTMIRYYLFSAMEISYIGVSEWKMVPPTDQIRSRAPTTINGQLAASSKYFEMGNIWFNTLDYMLLIVYGATMLGAFFCKDLTNYYNRVPCRHLDWTNLILSIVQWLCLAIYIIFITWLFCSWVINSFLFSLFKIEALLPYAFKTACLLYFIYLYVIRGRVVYKKSVESIQNELKNTLINLYIERLTLASNFSKEIDLAEKLRFSQTMSNLHGFNEPLPPDEIHFIINQVMRELRDQGMVPLQWTSFIKSILFEERQKILNSLHDIAEHPPLSLPQGSLELIAKILSIDENMESPEYFLNIISTILVKLMMTNDKITYKKLRLKDLDILRICDCPENSLLNEKFVCESCKNEALYSKNHQEIFKLSLEKNTAIILSLINLVDLIRKKTPGKILEVLVEKIIPEGLVGEEKDTVSSLMRLFFLAFFEIDQKFSRIDWGKSINDILLNYFKDEQNILQVLNLFDESHDDNLFDISMQFITNTDAVNSVKRSVVLESCPKETQSISRFLSFSTLLIGKDCTIPDKMAKDFLQFINKNSRLQISAQTLTVIMKFLIFSRETPKSIVAKIRLNAEKYFLDPELSDTIKDIKSISFGINKSMKTKDYQNLENSRIVKQIKKLTNLQGIEIIGFIYLINNKQDNDEVSKFYSHLFHANKLTKYETTLFDLLAIFVSNDHIKLSRAFQNLRLKYLRLFVYLKGIATRNSVAPLYVEEILNELPVASENYDTVLELANEALRTRDFSRFLLFISSKVNPEEGQDSKKVKNLRYLEFIANLTTNQRLTEVLSEYKQLFKEFDDSLLYDFFVKLLVVLEYTIQRQNLNSDSISIKVKATKILSDMMITKTENISKFFDLFLSKRLEDFIDAYCYFDEEFKFLLENNGKSLKNHIQYIEKSLWFLDEQISFYSKNPVGKICSLEYEEDLGVIIMKKIMMPEIKLKIGEIILLLGSIISKIFNEDQINSSNPQRIMKFFSNLFIYVLGDANSDLGDYFHQEHNESFIKMLINCRGTKSRSQRVNIFFEDLYKRDMLNTTLFLYFYQFLKKKLKREEFTLKNEMEVQIASDMDMYVELFDYIDLCINKNFNKFHHFIMSIHARIQKHQGINSNAYKKDDIEWDQFYNNILSLLDEKQPNLSFFSNLLKIPLNQLNFVYILNMLRNSTKADKVLNEANSSISFKEIVESINIAHSEVIQILKLCLNKADFESMDILLKSMGLIDEIDINLVMSLITIDTQLKVDTDESRVLIKKMNLYSEVFKRMKIDKDLAWGFIRILKGDMFSFKKFLTIADDEAPLNHTTFLGIVMALAGCRNTPFNHFKGDFQQTIPKLIEKYKEINQSVRQRKENSREVAHNLLKDYLQVSPFWGLLENQITKKMAGHTMVNQKIRRVIDIKETKSFSVFHFMILNSINNSSVDAIEIFSNLAFFHNVVFCLKSIMVSGKEESQNHYKDLLKFYIEIFDNVKRRFKELLKKDLLTLTFNNGLTNYIIFNDLLTDNIENISYYYYEKINKTLIDYWIDKMEREEVFQELIPKLQNLEHRSTLHSLFGTEPGALFKDPAIYDHFLESVTECMILEMKFLNTSFSKNSASSEQLVYQKEDNLAEGDDNSLESPNVKNLEESDIIFEEMNEESSDHDSNKELAMEEESQREDGNSMSDANEAEFKEDDAQEGVEKSDYVSNGIMDFCLYNLISRLKQGKLLKFEEKERHTESDQKKIDALFTLIEKLSFFTRNFSGFRKNKYSRLFSFSQGMIIGSDYPLRQKHSLYSPELLIHAQLHANKYNNAVIQENVDFPFEVKEFLGKAHMVKDLVEYDLANPNYYSPFGNISFDLDHFCKVREVPRVPEGPSALHDCYYSPFLMKSPFSKVQELKRLASTSSQIHIFKLLTSPLKNINPEYLVFLLIEQGFYSLSLETDECQQVCRQVFLNFFGQNLNLTSKITESYKSNFDLKLEGMQDQLFFLHDMAVGLYQVLPETKNLFSENPLLSKNMKIYLSILKLHGTFNKFSEWTLLESLEILSPYLASDKEKIRVIIDYVRNSKKNLGRAVLIFRRVR
jgi:hypothetical protein